MEEANAPAPQTVTEKVPATWPGAFGAYKYSAQVVKANLGTILFLILLSALASIIFGDRSGDTTQRDGVSFVADLLNMWFAVSMIVAFLAGIQSTKISLGESLKKGGSLFLKYFALTILTVLTLLVSLVLLIVPFFFVLPRIMLAPYFLVDKQLGPIEALKASWHQTKGHSGKVWGIIGAGIVMGILVLVLIGIYFLIMYSAVLAVLYTFIQNNSPTEPLPVEAPQQTPATEPTV